MYTAKKIQEQQSTIDRYELFTVRTMVDIDNNEVQVLESIGFYSLQELNEQKNNLLMQIESINYKINSINHILSV